MHIKEVEPGVWGVFNDDSEMVISFSTKNEASDWLAQWNKDQRGDDDTNPQSDVEGMPNFDWQDKFNLNLEDLFKKYGVDSDMRKYFEGMEFDPQEEFFLKDLFGIEQEKTELKKQGIARQRGSLMSGLDMNLENVMRSGETESFKLNQASTQRSQQVGGLRGGPFGDRFQSQTTQTGIYGQQNQMMGQAEAKLGTLDDAITSLDFEAKQAAIGFEQDVYGQRQQWMDDFFDRLMQVEQMEQS